ncbi:MAG: DAK2 domain-containing protein [Firmicutes bacterium]|nr:DAK2 domain-containing protein [Bacillota bacterium]
MESTYKSVAGAAFRKMIFFSARLLEQNKNLVDALNVFPVPDGDTGTNMSLTMQSASKEVAGCPNNNIADLANALAKGALRGARGNSGVILSQIFKGMSHVIANSSGEITPKIFAKSMAEGTAVAYKAVTKPKEGTILTVIRVMSEHAAKITKKTIPMDEFFKSVLDVGEETLAQTPEMLPVLKKAGVVDAGGRGLLILFSGFYNSLIGNESDAIDFDVSPKTEKGFKQFHEVDYNDLAEIEYAYCTEFFIMNMLMKTTEADIDRFREKLVTIGDCVLVIGDLALVKVHIHTNHPGEALENALKLGEIDKLKIENMLEQNRELKKQQAELKPAGMVAVCAGDGLNNIFKDLLVDVIIEGGQTMNPSADDIAKAADRVQAHDVFVFPNNKNIILAAEQAKEISKRNIHIIPTTNIPQGVAAALCFNPEGTAEDNIAAMTGAIASVKVGQVTYAVRTTNTGEFELKEGDIIGIDQKDIVAKGENVNVVTKQLVDKMMDKSVSNITLYFGSDVSRQEADEISTELSKVYPRCDVDTHFGGQPLYYYIISLE